MQHQPATLFQRPAGRDQDLPASAPNTVAVAEAHRLVRRREERDAPGPLRNGHIHHGREQQRPGLAFRGKAGHRFEVMGREVACPDRQAAVLEEVLHAKRGKSPVARPPGGAEWHIDTLLLDAGRGPCRRDKLHHDVAREVRGIAHGQRGLQHVLAESSAAVAQPVLDGHTQRPGAGGFTRDATGGGQQARGGWRDQRRSVGRDTGEQTRRRVAAPTELAAANGQKRQRAGGRNSHAERAEKAPA